MKKFEHCIAVMERALEVREKTIAEGKVRSDLKLQGEVAEVLAEDLRAGIALLREYATKGILSTK